VAVPSDEFPSTTHNHEEITVPSDEFPSSDQEVVVSSDEFAVPSSIQTQAAVAVPSVICRGTNFASPSAIQSLVG
jgi:hypothetical protein